MAKEETKLVLFLKSIGISGRYKGFYYLKEAVFLVLQDEHCLCKVQENIYRPIAERNHVSLAWQGQSVPSVSQHRQMKLSSGSSSRIIPFTVRSIQKS